MILISFCRHTFEFPYSFFCLSFRGKRGSELDVTQAIKRLNNCAASQNFCKYLMKPMNGRFLTLHDIKKHKLELHIQPDDPAVYADFIRLPPDVYIEVLKLFTGMSHSCEKMWPQLGFSQVGDEKGKGSEDADSEEQLLTPTVEENLVDLFHDSMCDCLSAMKLLKKFIRFGSWLDDAWQDSGDFWHFQPYNGESENCAKRGRGKLVPSSWKNERYLGMMFA